MNQLHINDIFSPVTVPDNSFYIFILYVTLLVFLVMIFYFFYKKRVIKNKKNEVYYLKILLNCDFNNAKRSAYLFTYYGRILAKTTEQKNELETIISQLLTYKYQKKSPNISQVLRDEIMVFVDELRDFYA